MVDYNKYKRLKANREKVKKKQKLNSSIGDPLLHAQLHDLGIKQEYKVEDKKEV